jgi:uncharacterized protein (UPF0335 family)
MTLTIGRNTIAGQALSAYVERIEGVRADKKSLGELESAIVAEAKSQGFIPAALRHVVKLRAMKPQDRQEAEAIVDTYLHALGMATDTPLFRQVGLMSVDTASREEVIESLKKFVPDNGSITIDAGGGRPVKLTRDKTGEVSVKEVVETPPPSMSSAPASPAAKAEPPNVDATGAEQLGRDAFTANQPIITNPFPFGDARRPRWDAGWRKASGTDGMGPDD